MGVCWNFHVKTNCGGKLGEKGSLIDSISIVRCPFCSWSKWRRVMGRVTGSRSCLFISRLFAARNLVDLSSTVEFGSESRSFFSLTYIFRRRYEIPAINNILSETEPTD